jgi:hypothetical protein
VELDNNVIDGGTGSCAAVPVSGFCGNAGVVAGVGTLVTLANKIYGGDATGKSDGTSVGISASGVKGFTAENNMIHGGNKSGAASHGSASGIELTQVTAPTLINNTIFSGSAGSAAGQSAAGIVISLSVSGFVAENNLFATSGTNDFGLIVSCSASLIDTFDNNVFLAPTTLVRFGGGGTANCGGSAKMDFTTITSADSFFTSSSAGAKVTGNARFASPLQCSGDSAAQCTQTFSCASASQCASYIFTNWSAADTGFTILQSDGWKVNPICEVSQGGLDVTATLKTDFYGTTRTVPLSAGAHEQDATCAN